MVDDLPGLPVLSSKSYSHRSLFTSRAVHPTHFRIKYCSGQVLGIAYRILIKLPGFSRRGCQVPSRAKQVCLLPLHHMANVRPSKSRKMADNSKVVYSAYLECSIHSFYHGTHRYRDVSTRPLEFWPWRTASHHLVRNTSGGGQRLPRRATCIIPTPSSRVISMKLSTSRVPSFSPLCGVLCDIHEIADLGGSQSLSMPVDCVFSSFLSISLSLRSAH
ncbi:hypothetical protein BCR34DRAFT_157595 [Clohesyomyces aquaticus]|uniref:Uncharacterized protein n=1 Tax=Clohesyomyces aquaticus TaxID=1231657 RepID=A0A1Y1YJI3_9PLEO|nr:hypothetical protein BCR34DRAFT_157595 [Clohesyomyces aquaticus]